MKYELILTGKPASFLDEFRQDIGIVDIITSAIQSGIPVPIEWIQNADWTILHWIRDTLHLTRGTLYISHRLSSCKFRDEIAVFHKGAVIQQGFHEKLVADAAGKYYELWSAQAQYYTE